MNILHVYFIQSFDHPTMCHTNYKLKMETNIRFLAPVPLNAVSTVSSFLFNYSSKLRHSPFQFLTLPLILFAAK